MSYELKGDMLQGSLNAKQALEGTGYPRGNDGISPTVEVTEVDGGNYVVVTDIYGRHDLFIQNGKDGKDGDQGARGDSPKAYISSVKYDNLTTGVVYSLRYASIQLNGETLKEGDLIFTISGHLFVVENPEPTPYGDITARFYVGLKGADGFSPVAKVTQTTTGATITITDKTGTTTATVTNGQDGKDGADGISPTVAVSKSGKVTTVSITDKSGTKTATINDGADGNDYVITDADKAEIAEEAAKLVEIPDANAKAFVVNATENDATNPYTYYADKTSQEIYEAWQNGEIIVCKYQTGFFRAELNPVAYDSDVMVFSNDLILPKEYTGDEELNIYVCLVIAGSQVHCFYNQLATQEFVLEQIANSGGGSGEPGADGFSPSAKVTQTTTGATITITDKDGTTYATVRNGVDGKDGKDGHTPQKNVDYFDGKDGDSGVFVGSGDMPANCNVQIDPDGESLSVDWLIDAVIEKLPIYNGEVVAV